MKKTACFAVMSCAFLVCAETLTFNTPADWQHDKFFTPNENGGMTAVFGGPVLSKKVIELDKNKQYFISADIKAAEDSPKGSILLGFRSYDEKGVQLLAHQCQSVAGTDTELLESTEPGDTYIKVKDASKWKIHPYMVIAWNTKPDRSDLPNRKILLVNPKKIEKQDDGWIIHLDKPVNAVLPAGTAIREHSRGGELYLGLGSTTKPVSLKKRRIYWWRGAAKARVFFLTIPAKKGERLKLNVSNLVLESK
ncbi:MAG: hypothetical protein E7055_05630 [Lentisphaerae bacterium]|nr:hypothetical protein [Lentisphaerota bacterium]